MKKLITIVMVAVMLLVPMMAQALQSLEDTRIARPAPTSEEPSGCPLTASKVMQSIRKTTDGGLAGLKSSIVALKTAIENKDTETAKAIERKDTETAQEIGGLRTDMKNGFSNMSSSINSLDRKLTDKKDGEFSKTNAKIDSIDSAILWMTIAIILAIAALGLLVFFRTRGTNKLVTDVGTKVDGSPKKTVDLMKKLEEFIITFSIKDTAGIEHEVSYIPPIVMVGAEERYLTLYVPKSGAGPVPADASDIARVAIRDQHQVVTSTKDVAKWYFDAANANPADDRGKNQRALIDALKGTPQLNIC